VNDNEAVERVASHLDDLLNIPRQVWLLGAGISCDAGIPLMYDLTKRVDALLSSQKNELGTLDSVRSAVMRSETPTTATTHSGNSGHSRPQRVASWALIRGRESECPWCRCPFADIATSRRM